MLKPDVVEFGVSSKAASEGPTIEDCPISHHAPGPPECASQPDSLATLLSRPKPAPFSATSCSIRSVFESTASGSSRGGSDPGAVGGVATGGTVMLSAVSP